MSNTSHGTPQPQRELANLRDLGGIPVEGGAVAYGLVFRSDDVAVITPRGASALAELGITDLIDLRSLEELERTGRGEMSMYPVHHHHRPLTDGATSPVQLHDMAKSGGDTSEVFGQWYADLAIDRVDVLVQCLRIITAAEGATLFHCTAGKDRTGVLAACLLTVLGADRDAIVADYVRTQPAMDVILADVEARSPGLLPTTPGWRQGASLNAYADTMVTMLDILQNRDDDILALLAAAGFDAPERDRLRQRLLER